MVISRLSLGFTDSVFSGTSDDQSSESEFEGLCRFADCGTKSPAVLIVCISGVVVLVQVADELDKFTSKRNSAEFRSQKSPRKVATTNSSPEEDAKVLLSGTCV